MTRKGRGGVGRSSIENKRKPEHASCHDEQRNATSEAAPAPAPAPAAV